MSYCVLCGCAIPPSMRSLACSRCEYDMRTTPYDDKVEINSFDQESS